MADETRSGRIGASLSILCAVAATIMPSISRLLYARSAPGDDTYFSALSLMPVLYLVGLVLAVLARRRAGKDDRLTRVALWLNVGMLAALVLFALWATFSYRGR